MTCPGQEVGVAERLEPNSTLTPSYFPLTAGVPDYTIPVSGKQFSLDLWAPGGIDLAHPMYTFPELGSRAIWTTFPRGQVSLDNSFFVSEERPQQEKVGIGGLNAAHQISGLLSFSRACSLIENRETMYDKEKCANPNVHVNQ